MKRVLLVCAAFLFMGIAHFPIGFYTAVRIVVCLGSCLVIYDEFKGEFSLWIILFGLMAILFNPIVPVFLNNREAWMPIDIICGIICLIKAFGNEIQNSGKTDS